MDLGNQAAEAAQPTVIGSGAPGTRIARGTATFTGNTTDINTGLESIDQVIVSVKDANQGAGDAGYVTYDHGADGLLDLYAWDDAGAAAANAATVSWVAFGK